MAPTKEPSEADIIFNRANVALAKSQRLIASWLPPKTSEELKQAKSEEELEREDKELFAPVPEVLGVGAPLPRSDDAFLSRRKLTSDDKLLQQLIGKKAAKERALKAQNAASTPASTQVVKPIRTTNQVEEEEEHGRASMFASKKQKKRRFAAKAEAEVQDDISDNESEAKIARVATEGPDSSTTKGKKRRSTYLDDLLASRAQRKKRKAKDIAVDD